MSGISSLNPYASSTTTSASSLVSGLVKEKTYSEDEVDISVEAQELIDELRYKENLSYIRTENEYAFDKVSKKLPATEGFDDMLEWLSSIEVEEGFSLGGTVGDPNRNIYEKDPEKYAELWGNMYNHFTDLMETLGLDNDDTMKREVLSTESVAPELLMRFTSSFSQETNELLTYFNITV